MGLIKDINNILKYGQKTTTYKYATLLAIFDYIVEHPSEASINNLHFIPIVYLAKQFISYYYPLSFHDFYQGSLAKGKRIKIFNYIDEFQKNLRNEPLTATNKKYFNKIISSRESGIFWINTLFNLHYDLPNCLIKLLWKVRKLILDQPLQYLHNVKGETIRFFGLICDDVSFKSRYDVHREISIRQDPPKNLNWIKMLQYDKSSIIIDDLTYRNLGFFRFWAREVILKAWFDYCINR
ncbi:MAG: hypothetical protein ACTSSM_12635, partial [Promethearchaeota archaeon]